MAGGEAETGHNSDETVTDDVTFQEEEEEEEEEEEKKEEEEEEEGEQGGHLKQTGALVLLEVQRTSERSERV